MEIVIKGKENLKSNNKENLHYNRPLKNHSRLPLKESSVSFSLKEVTLTTHEDCTPSVTPSITSLSLK